MGTWTICTPTASFNFDPHGPSAIPTWERPIGRSTKRIYADLSSEVRKHVLRTLAALHAVRSAVGIQRGQTSSAEAHSAAVAEEVTATSGLGPRALLNHVLVLPRGQVARQRDKHLFHIAVVNTVAERMVMAFADRTAGPKDLDMHVLRACVNLEVVHAAGDDLRARQVATRRP